MDFTHAAIRNTVTPLIKRVKTRQNSDCSSTVLHSVGGFWRELERRVWEHGDGWRGLGLLLGLWLDQELRSSSVEQRRELWDRQREWLCPPIHWVVLVDHKRLLKIPPDQTRDGVVQRRCHSVQMHTNEDSSPYLPSSLHTSRQQLTL